MTTKQVIQSLKREIKKIEKEWDVSNWCYVSADRLDGVEAYDMGYYEAMKATLHNLENGNNTIKDTK
jgi:hypothetical protein